MTGRISIEDVTPAVDCGYLPSKAVIGERIPVEATVWREGHDAVAATLVWCGPDPDAPEELVRMTPDPDDEDRWHGEVTADRQGMWTFRIEAWSDPWATWRHAVRVKVDAGQDAEELANDLHAGARLLDQVAARPQYRYARAESRQLLLLAAGALRDATRPLPDRIELALSEPVHHVMTRDPVRELVTQGETRRVLVERPRALFGSWYEFFPRSTGGRDADGRPVHGSFKTAAEELPRIAAMGFDVVYLPPIHPIGRVNRKGANNSLHAGPDDVGSPWAIGSAVGGLDAIHPQLGTIEDFDAFVARADELGLEVALDLALQAAPDHPWVSTHPEWFTTLPDGSIAYAENPPKKYQDIYPINFDNDPDGIYAEVLRVVLHWVEHGVRIFRVDNPHTKPPNFWQWLIGRVRAEHPDVLFLAEAFTRPARLYGLARLGFSQSYTYFTWRTGKQELTEFGTDLVRHIDEARPNLFVNTQDILHETLQRGGPGMFAIRAVLAAMFSPTWGVYSGYELYEDRPLREGSEEYLDSEKYQLRPRDFAGALAEGCSLEPWLRKLNLVRRAHPALRQMRTLRFHHVDNEALLAFSKTDPSTSDQVLCVVSLNPFGVEEGTVWLDLPALGMDRGERFDVLDEVTGARHHWAQANYVRLEPWRAVAHILSVCR